MDGNIWLMRYPLSSGSSVRELQVLSVMIASQGNPYRAVSPLANANGKLILKILAITNAAIAIPITPMMIMMSIGPIRVFSMCGVQSFRPENTLSIAANMKMV